MNSAAKIYQFKTPQRNETIELRDVEAVCRLLQRELVRLAQLPHQRGRGKPSQMQALSARSGVGALTISRILYGDTHAPRFNTCVRLLDALGWTLIASR